MKLPDGWLVPDEAQKANLAREFQVELSPIHPLWSRKCEIVGWRGGQNDEILIQILDFPNRYCVVHLTWSGKSEQSEHFPSIPFMGNLEHMVDYEYVLERMRTQPKGQGVSVYEALRGDFDFSNMPEDDWLERDRTPLPPSTVFEDDQ